MKLPIFFIVLRILYSFLNIKLLCVRFPRFKYFQKICSYIQNFCPRAFPVYIFLKKFKKCCFFLIFKVPKIFIFPEFKNLLTKTNISDFSAQLIKEFNEFKHFHNTQATFFVVFLCWLSINYLPLLFYLVISRQDNLPLYIVKQKHLLYF